jgi:hypothetical protein
LAPHVFPALAVLLHGVICEVVRGWPTLEFRSNYGTKVDPASPFKLGRRGTVRCEYCTPDENGLRVLLNQEPRMPLKEAWPKFKHHD